MAYELGRRIAVSVPDTAWTQYKFSTAHSTDSDATLSNIGRRRAIVSWLALPHHLPRSQYRTWRSTRVAAYQPRALRPWCSTRQCIAPRGVPAYATSVPCTAQRVHSEIARCAISAARTTCQYRTRRRGRVGDRNTAYRGYEHRLWGDRCGGKGTPGGNCPFLSRFRSSATKSDLNLVAAWPRSPSSAVLCATKPKPRSPIDQIDSTREVSMMLSIPNAQVRTGQRVCQYRTSRRQIPYIA
eukprot:2059117-Rhodomonas_salina.2